MAFSMFAFLPVVQKLGEYLSQGIDLASNVLGSTDETRRANLTLVLTDAMQSWDPEVQGRKLLDDATRRHAAAFIAGVSLNFVRRKQAA